MAILHPLTQDIKLPRKDPSSSFPISIALAKTCKNLIKTQLAHEKLAHHLNLSYLLLL